MSSVYTVDILNKACYDLKQDLRPDEVLDYLLSQSVLSQSEYDRCREVQGRHNQCRQLLDLLKHKGEDGYKQFCVILEKTQPHLKSLLDDIARKEGAPQYVYISEICMEEALAEKEKIIALKEKDIEERTREIQNLTQDLQSLKTSHKHQITKLEELHEQEVKHLKEEHAASVEKIETEKTRLETELNQERERKTAVQNKLDDERHVTSKLNEEKSCLEEKLRKQEEKYESCISVQAGDEPERLEELGKTSVTPVKTGQCVLETSADCDNKQLFLLPCLHSVCKSCVDQHRDKGVICRCGQEMNIEKESLPHDYVSKNKAMLSSQTYECGYLTEPCRNKVISHCSTCNIPLCQKCQKRHGISRVNSTHDVIAVEHIARKPPWKHPNHTTCTEHHGQKLVYVDKLCKKSICNICHTGAHEGHEVKALETEDQEKRNQLVEDIQRQEDRLEEFRKSLENRRERLSSLQQNHVQMEKEVAKVHEKIAVKYLHRVRDLLRTLKDESRKIQGKILEDINYLSESVAMMETTITYGKESLDFTSQAELLELCDIISKRMKEDLTRSLPEDKTLKTHIVFSGHGEKALEQLVEMFGEIKCRNSSDAEEDNTPTTTDLQLRLEEKEDQINQLQVAVTKLTGEEDDIRKQGEAMVAVIEAPLSQQGIYFLKPSTMEKSFILQCIQLKFDRDRVNINKAHITTEGDLVNTAQPAPHDHSKVRLVKYIGTTSTAPLPRCGSPQYWEVRGTVGINKTLTGNILLLQIGLCKEEEQDQHHSIDVHPHSYSLTVSHCTRHSSICRKVCKHGKHVLCLPDPLPNTPGHSITLQFGVVLDDSRCRVVFIDLNINKVVSVIDEVDCSQPLWPMFGTYNPHLASASLSLVVGNDIDMTEEKKAIILKSLS